MISLLICLFILPSHSLYFYLEQGVPKCFLEEVNQDTLMVASYESKDFTKLGGLQITSNIKNPRMSVVDTKTLTEKGRVVYTSEVRGTHHLCFTAGNENQPNP